MGDQHHISRQSDDEEEDLELLRLAALKSLHIKKESSTSNYHTLQTQSRNVQSTGNSYALPHLVPNYSKNTSVHVEPDNHALGTYYVAEHNLPPQRSTTNLVDNYDSRQRLDKIEVNEPYVPQHIAPINPTTTTTTTLCSTGNGWVPEANNINNGYTPYVPHALTENIPLGVGNVQLSPRSLAFVAENNDILTRRKGESIFPKYRYACRSSSKTPPYRTSSPPYRSPSPLYRQSPGRWSISPPPKSKSRSPLARNRLHHYSHPRSTSRSPPPSRGRSPVYRRRSISRTPPSMPASRHISPYHRYSPRSPRLNNKHLKSKSPVPRNRNRISPRRLSRSPVPSRYGRLTTKSPPNVNGRRRSPLPAARHSNKGRFSPNHQRRSPVHNHDSNETRHTNWLRSPGHQAGNTARSRSRSPIRKYPRKSRERYTQNTQAPRRRSPHNNSRRRHDASVNNYRNRARKRSASPMSNRRKMSRSRSADRSRRDENKIRRTNEKTNRKLEEKPKSEKRDDVSMHNTDRTVKSVMLNGTSNSENGGLNEKRVELSTKKESGIDQKKESTNHKLDKENDGRNLSKKSDERNEDESSDDEDGIDLFPSDESESENEGRFKLSTSKKERDENVPTPSFTKLGEPSVPVVVKDLTDIETSTNKKNSKEDRERADRNRSSYDSRRREERFRKSDSNRNSRERRRANGSSKRDREDNVKFEEKRKEAKPMFKSTFQAVENEGKLNGKFIDEKDSNERRSSVQNKKRLQKEEIDSPEKESTEKLSSAVANSNGGNNGNSGKKPIHLRLGAMTNTFKSPKKSSTWNTSDKV